jgi:RNA polymerase sigma factor (sigma-70 family)
MGSVSDGQLLERFITGRDEAAFAALVERHGPMVWGVCRRVLPRHHDAEEAFQATFLVLARKATSVNHRETVAHWLHAVAYQTARKARALAFRRASRERGVSELPEPESPACELTAELMQVVDEELNRLPDHYRAPVVLCDLEGRTRREASVRLGWPEGTVSSRLSRARALLARRLTRRGIGLSGALLAALLEQTRATAKMAPPLPSSTVRMAALIRVGEAAATTLLSPRVASLTGGVIQSMLLSKLKMTLVALFAVGLLSAGLVASGLADQPPRTEPQAQTGSAPPSGPIAPKRIDPQPNRPHWEEFLARWERRSAEPPHATRGRPPAMSNDEFTTILRRAYLDTLGRPPTPAEIQSAQAERQADLVLRLLSQITARTDAKGNEGLAEWVRREIASPDVHTDIQAGLRWIVEPNAQRAPHRDGPHELSRLLDEWQTLEASHANVRGAGPRGEWQNCRSCHRPETPREPAFADADKEALRTQIARQLLARQAVSEVEGALERLKKDVPDPDAQREALTRIEQAVRAAKEELKAPGK